jgi:hypothetical protein
MRVEQINHAQIESAHLSRPITSSSSPTTTTTTTTSSSSSSRMSWIRALATTATSFKPSPLTDIDEDWW